MPYFTAIEEVLDYMKDNVLQPTGTLAELKHVGFADDELFFEYPALVIAGEPVRTEIHATHQFKNYFGVSLFIYHGQINENRTVRTRNDLILATKVKARLATDRKLGGGVIFGWIDQVIPGTIRRPGNVFAIGTRMSWRGEALEAFQ
jgi:hypothetical protein